MTNRQDWMLTKDTHEACLAMHMLGCCDRSPGYWRAPTRFYGHTALLSVYEFERRLGHAKVVCDGVGPFDVSRAQLFFGELGATDGPVEKDLWISATSPHAMLLWGEVGLENGISCFNARCEVSDEGRWRLLVSADPEGAKSPGFYNDAVILPYVTKGLRRVLRVPLYLSVVQ